MVPVCTRCIPQPPGSRQPPAPCPRGSGKASAFRCSGTRRGCCQQQLPLPSADSQFPIAVTGLGAAAQHRHLVLSTRTEFLSHISVLPTCLCSLVTARPRASPGFRNSTHEALYFFFLLYRSFLRLCIPIHVYPAGGSCAKDVLHSERSPDSRPVTALSPACSSVLLAALVVLSRGAAQNYVTTLTITCFNQKQEL